ncbi:MAG: hypothetical protein LBV08_09595 [Clostridiales bacterium]|jgi:hypothetical protein|nr:hypothetical protein [Clostridiales bacterium]
MSLKEAQLRKIVGNTLAAVIRGTSCRRLFLNLMEARGYSAAVFQIDISTAD